MSDKPIGERVATLEEQMKVANHRIDDLENISNSIYEINITNNQILEQIKVMNEQMAKTNNRIDEIEKKPLKNYESIKSKVRDTVITVVITATITSFIAMCINYIKIGG